MNNTRRGAGDHAVQGLSGGLVRIACRSPGPRTLPAHTGHNRAVPAATALSELGVRPNISQGHGDWKKAERRGLARLHC